MIPERNPTRRQLLGGVGLVALSTLTGCIGVLSGDEPAEEFTFGGAYVQNQSQEALTFDLEVLREGKVVHEVSSRTLEPGEPRDSGGLTIDTYVTECEWEEDPATRYEIRFREAETSDWESLEVDGDTEEAGCYWASIAYLDRTGDWHAELGDECGFLETICDGQ